VAGVLRDGARGDDEYVAVVRAPGGAALTCKGWPQEAAMRMLMNNLDLNTASGASRVSIDHGGGGIGRSIHAGQLADARGLRVPIPPGP
jgi:urocanate hydratase